MNVIYNLSNILISNQLTLRDAMVYLDLNGLQALLLEDEEKKLSGVLTDGDIRRHIINDGLMEDPVQNIATKDFIKSLDEDESHLQKMFEIHDVNHIPIIDKNGLVKFLVTRNSEKIKNKVPVVIVAGGMGTRLLPLTNIIPKPLMPVGDVTMIEKIMDNFYKQGLNDFKLIINYKKDLIKTYLNEVDHPYNIEYIEEKTKGGTAGGLALLNDMKGPFIVTNCDILANLSYQTLLDWHTDSDAEMTILGVRKTMEIPYGVIKMDSKYHVSEIHEKPFYNNLIVSGIYVMNPSVLNLIPKSNVIGMDKLIKILIQKKMNLTCFPIESGWHDIGNFDEYNKFLQL